MDMQNNKQCNALTHARMKCSQSETSSFPRGGIKTENWAQQIEETL